MRFSQVFDDLETFVEVYRGRVSREGMVLWTDTPYQVGTVLEIDITLAAALPLVRGTAGVVRVTPAFGRTDSGLSVVLEFLELDPDSAAFLRRLTDRLAAEGAPLPRMAEYSDKGRREAGQPPPDPADRSRTGLPSAVPATAEPQAPSPLARLSLESARRHHARQRRARWAVGVVGLAVAATGAGLALHRIRSGSSIASAADLGPAPAPERAGPTTLVSSARSAVARIAAGAPRGVTTTTSTQPVLDRASVIERVLWSEVEGTTVVRVEADGALDPAAIGHFLMADRPQPRLVIYLYGIGSAGLAYRIPVGGERLDAIRVWYHDDKQPVQLHLVLDLTHAGVAAEPPSVAGRVLEVRLTGNRGLEVGP